MSKNQIKQNDHSFKWLPLVVLILTQIGTTGDNAVQSIATNSLIQHLGMSMNEIQLANMMYPMIAGCFMIVSGMLGIAYGFKRIFRVGAVIAAIGEAVLATTNSITIFIWVGRLLVGVGGSLMIPAVLGLIPEIYQTREHRAIAFGAIGGRFRNCYYGAYYFVLIFFGSFLIPDTDQIHGFVRLDFTGTILAFIGLFVFLIGTSKVSEWGLIKAINAPFTIFGLSPAIPMMILGIVILVLLLKVEEQVEKEHGFALIPLKIMKYPFVEIFLRLEMPSIFY